MKFHLEHHRIYRVGWLRAAVLGANDGLISTASLIMGVAAAELGTHAILLTGVAALVGGALSMAAGEYVSVSSQSDSEHADLARERAELANAPEAEHRELAAIYVQRGLSRELADRVATEMTAHDALGAHARDELGITATNRAQPVLAAATSALSFAVGAAVPLLLAVLLPAGNRESGLFVTTLALLIALGALGAKLGGARIQPAALRVGFWGVFAMGATALVGHLFGVGPT
jgi:VIT1/CCC1 family predicted Fe2+/Mn2+ transporter